MRAPLGGCAPRPALQCAPVAEASQTPGRALPFSGRLREQSPGRRPGPLQPLLGAGLAPSLQLSAPWPLQWEPGVGQAGGRAVGRGRRENPNHPTDTPGPLWLDGPRGTDVVVPGSGRPHWPGPGTGCGPRPSAMPQIPGCRGSPGTPSRLERRRTRRRKRLIGVSRLRRGGVGTWGQDPALPPPGPVLGPLPGPESLRPRLGGGCRSDTCPVT